MWAKGEITFCERITRTCRFRVIAKPGAIAARRSLPGCNRLIRCHRKRGRDSSQPIAVAGKRIKQRAIFQRDEARKGRQSAQVHICGGHRMRTRIIAQRADIAGERDSCLHPAQTGALGQGVLDPVCPLFAVSWCAWMIIQKDQRMRMLAAVLRGQRHAFAQPRHDHIDPGRQ